LRRLIAADGDQQLEDLGVSRELFLQDHQQGRRFGVTAGRQELAGAGDALLLGLFALSLASDFQEFGQLRFAREFLGQVGQQGDALFVLARGQKPSGLCKPLQSGILGLALVGRLQERGYFLVFRELLVKFGEQGETFFKAAGAEQIPGIRQSLLALLELIVADGLQKPGDFLFLGKFIP